MDKKAAHELSPIQGHLEELWEALSGEQRGAVASYIPELSQADPAWFGIALVTVDGQVYQVGESRRPFTIQSISKASTYGLAPEDNGLERVLAKVGTEPSGEAFNSISLEPGTGRPLNPMINADAIATAGLVAGTDEGHRLQRLLEAFSHYTGHTHSVDDKVYRSEKTTGHRNRAIAHLLFGSGILDREPEDVLDLYFKQCSILVTARDLACVAACLTNGAVNPVTGVVALQGRHVHRLLSVMSTCGMYDFAGGWLYDVGMPAKSGVGGGIMAVLPGQFGLGVFSPRLDEKGNSVRGLEVCRRLSDGLRLHVFDVPRATSAAVIRRHYDARAVRLRRMRGAQETEVIAQRDERIRVYQLQGDLRFGSTESIVQALLEDLDGMDFLIIDMRRVFSVDHASGRILASHAARMRALGKHVLFTETLDLYALRKQLQAELTEPPDRPLLRFADSDHALEWCENELIRRHRPDALSRRAAPDLHDHYLCQGMSDEQRERLRQRAHVVSFKRGEAVFHNGDAARSLFFIIEGEVDVTVKSDPQRPHRLATLTPGMCFGELTVLNEGTRSADVIASADTSCYEVYFEDLDDAIRTRLLTALAAQLSHKLRSDNREVELLG